MSINWKKSAELNHCTVDELKARFKRFPKSNKHVIAICEGNRNCDEREVYFYAYTDLCGSCMSLKRWEDPEECEKQSERQKKRLEDPEEREKMFVAVNKRWEDPKEHEKQSIRMIKRFEDPKEREKTSIGQKKRYGDSEEHEKSSEGQRKRYEDPVEHEKSSISQLKRYAKMDDPGLEICTNHYIYDFNDLDKYTIEITRSEHMTIHNNLRHAGLQVTCINIMVND